MVFLPGDFKSLAEDSFNSVLLYLSANDLKSLLYSSKKLYETFLKERCLQTINYLSMFPKQNVGTDRVILSHEGESSFTRLKVASTLDVLNVVQAASAGWSGNVYMLTCAVKSLQTETDNNPSLVGITINQSCWDFTGPDECLSGLKQIGRFVADLTLGGDSINAGRDLSQIVCACTSLKHLRLTDVSILHPLPTTSAPNSSCSSLTISSGKQTYVGLHSLFGLFGQLNHLSLHSCKYQQQDKENSHSDFSFNSIYVQACPELTDDILTRLFRKAETLRIICCNHLTTKFIESLKDRVHTLDLDASIRVPRFIEVDPHPDRSEVIVAMTIAALQAGIPEVYVHNLAISFRAKFADGDALCPAPTDDKQITTPVTLCQWVLNNRPDLTELAIVNTEETEENETVLSIHRENNLRCLYLSSQTIELIKNLVLGAEKLRELCVLNVQSRDPFCLIQKLPTSTSPLTHLQFQNCPLLDDEAIVALFNKVVFPHLSSIHISHCPNITGRGWIQQARGGPMGINVSAFGCLNIPTGNLPLLGQHTYPVFGATPPIDPAQPQPEPRRPSLITRVTHVGKSVIMGLKISIFYVARFASRIWSGVSRIWIWR